MWELAQRASPPLGLREAAMPYMEDLQTVVGQSTQLGLAWGFDISVGSGPRGFPSLTRGWGALLRKQAKLPGSSHMPSLSAYANVPARPG